MEANELIEQIKNSNDTWRKSQCRHTMPDGHRCGSPAMRNERYCYYHHATRKPLANPQLRQARRNSFQMPRPDSRAAIQQGLGDLITHIAYNDIDPRRAGLLLFALQIATTNLNHHQRTQPETKPTEPDTPSNQPNVVNTPSPQNKCHPEPSGVAAQSKDLRLHSVPSAPNSDFEAEAFPKPEPQLSPIRRETAAALIEAIARYKGIEPQSGSPEDREPETPIRPTRCTARSNNLKVRCNEQEGHPSALGEGETKDERNTADGQRSRLRDDREGRDREVDHQSKREAMVLLLGGLQKAL